MVEGGKCRQLEGGNLPVGLLSEATFESGTMRMSPGSRLVLVTDGVTEAENSEEDMFGCERLEALFPHTENIEQILHAVVQFCAGNPFNDDCTVLQLGYRTSVPDPSLSATSAPRP
jgi:serine phosphatase RsbU (regulator of sigma subunit)